MVRMKKSGFGLTKGSRLLAGTCMLAMAALPQLAVAQEAAPEERANRGLDTIVVTARYVEENIQDTPIAITAQSQEQLTAANVTDIGTLGAVVPNLYTQPGAQQSAGTPIISLRGVQQGESSSLAVPPAIGIYTDGVYHSTTAGSELDFTDVVRIEVNRGPQSTLSGNASIGGSISLFTQDPKGDGSGSVTLGYGTRNHMEAAGVIDIGITDSLAVRAFGHFDTQTGYGNRLDFTCMMDRLGTPELAGTLPYFQPDSAKKDCIIGHTGGGTRSVGQVKLLWEPTAGISLLLTARRSEEEMEETATTATSYANGCFNPDDDGIYPNGGGPQPCSAGSPHQDYHLATFNTYGILLDPRFLTPVRGNGRYDTYATNCRPVLDKSGSVNGRSFPDGYPDGLCYPPTKTAEHTLLSAELNAEITDNINLTAIGAYTKYGNEFTGASDQSPISVVLSHFRNEDEMYSGEVRLDGTLLEDDLQWVVGAFTVKTDGVQDNMISFVDIYQISNVHGINKSSSGFGHVDYSLTDRWRISGGGRYTHTDIAITLDNPQAVTVTDFVHSTQNRFDWRIGTDFRINDDIMVYASAATGSRPPGLTTILNTPRQLSPTSAEELISYEAGIKGDLFDRRVRLNLTAFYLDYIKLSTTVSGTECQNEPGPTATFFNIGQSSPEALTDAFCGQFVTAENPVPAPITFNTNVGIPASVKGFEWEITALPIDGLRIDWSGGYNKFKSGVAAGEPGYLFPGNLRQPEWGMHANISYDIETDAGIFTPRLDWNWQSKQTQDRASGRQAPDPAFIIEPYGLFNAQIAYESPDADWSAVLKVNNLANRYYHFQVLRGSVNGRTRVGTPREWMLTLRKEF